MLASALARAGAGLVNRPARTGCHTHQLDGARRAALIELDPGTDDRERTATADFVHCFGTQSHTPVRPILGVMPRRDPKSVTALLADVRAGRKEAMDDLMAVVYPELRQIAGH